MPDKKHQLFCGVSLLEISALYLPVVLRTVFSLRRNCMCQHKASSEMTVAAERGSGNPGLHPQVVGKSGAGRPPRQPGGTSKRFLGSG